MNKKQRIVFWVIGIIFCTSFLLSSLAFAKESPEYMLARINAGRNVSKNDETVKKFRHMLEVLEEKTGTPKQEIADLTLTIWQESEYKRVGLLKFMKEMCDLVDFDDFERMEYSKVMAAYVISTIGYSQSPK